MQNIYKTFLTLALGVLFFLSLPKCLAQPPQFRGQVNNLINNNQMRLQNQMQMNMMNIRGVQSTGLEYDFVVVFWDNTQKEVTSAIYTDSISRKRFIIFVDKKYEKTDTNRYKKIFPSQTINLIYPSLSSDDYTGPLQGRPNDSCWVFKAIAGRLTVYSDLVIADPSYLSPSMIIGIRLDDGPIVKFNTETLRTMVGQNVKALGLIEDKEYIRAIKRFNRDSEKEERKKRQKS